MNCECFRHYIAVIVSSPTALFLVPFDNYIRPALNASTKILHNPAENVKFTYNIKYVKIRIFPLKRMVRE